MNKVITLLMCSALSFGAFSQEKKDEKLFTGSKERTQEKTVSHSSKPVTISKKAGEEQKVHDAAYYQFEIDKVEQHILAIETKVNAVLNDPSEKAIAEENGWFQKMNATKERLTLKRNKLQAKLSEL